MAGMHVVTIGLTARPMMPMAVSVRRNGSRLEVLMLLLVHDLSSRRLNTPPGYRSEPMQGSAHSTRRARNCSYG
jgi:hypothetical protein